MRDVKIYTVMSDDLSPPIKGEGFCTDMVRFSDYAALQAERDALTAQCEASKKAVDLWNRWADPEDKIPENLSTDAFLRDQIAKGVDAVCLKISNAIPSCGQDEIIGLDAAVTICGAFAAQLRAGEAV